MVRRKLVKAVLSPGIKRPGAMGNGRTTTRRAVKAKRVARAAYVTKKY